eukprot:3217315-Pyramimonas_sp.AAC.2
MIHRELTCDLRGLRCGCGSVGRVKGMFPVSAATNQTQEARAYSHDGPIRQECAAWRLEV